MQLSSRKTDVHPETASTHGWTLLFPCKSHYPGNSCSSWKKKRHSVHLETNLPSTIFICSASSCLSRLHSARCVVVCDAPLLVFKWCLKAQSFAFTQRGESLHYPCRLFEPCYRGLVPVYVFLPCAACIPEHSLKTPQFPADVRLCSWCAFRKKGLKRLQTGKKKKKKTKKKKKKKAKDANKWNSCFLAIFNAGEK